MKDNDNQENSETQENRGNSYLQKGDFGIGNMSDSIIQDQARVSGTSYEKSTIINVNTNSGDINLETILSSRKNNKQSKLRNTEKILFKIKMSAEITPEQQTEYKTIQRQFEDVVDQFKDFGISCRDKAFKSSDKDNLIKNTIKFLLEGNLEDYQKLKHLFDSGGIRKVFDIPVKDIISNNYFPLTILSASREEYYGQDANHQPLKLTIRDAKTGQETQLPEDLSGHVFFLAPVGSVKSKVITSDNQEQIILPSQDGWTPLFNGDGMIYKLSFKNKGATLKTRLTKPPCYQADKATSDSNKDYQELAFSDLGISRNSPESLGSRNQLNIAFLRFKTSTDANERLLVTGSIGRPHEIDSETLETFNPVGRNSNWATMLPIPEQPFKQLMTSARPCFAPDENKVYTINVGKSLWTMFGLSRSFNARLRDNAKFIANLEQNSNESRLVIGVMKLYRKLLKFTKSSTNFIGFFSGISQKFAKSNFVHLMCWDGKQVEMEQQWNILLPGKKPLVIDQTVHQIGLTEKYLIIAESAFKFSLENTLPSQRSTTFNSFKIWLADFFDYPQFP
ncbi:MAG: carotenoid oxygenase family protein, partial [Cyanobacteria bacterium P01_F01_bin.143]